MKIVLIRVLCALAVLSASAHAQTAPSQQYIEIRDLSGRMVTVPKNPKRIVLTSARQIYWLSMIRNNPFKNVVGMDGTWWKYDSHFYNVLSKKFPEAKNIPNLGNGQNTDFNVEMFIKLNPDIVLMSSYHEDTIKTQNMVKKLAKFNIPVVFLDSSTHRYLSNIQSLRVLGKIFDKTHHTEKLEDFILTNLNMVFKRVGATKTMLNRPTAIMQLSPGYSASCCYVVGRDGFGYLMEDAGAENWGGKSFPAGGQMNIEQIFVSDFDKVLMTGGAWATARSENVGKFLELGYQANKQDLKKSFDHLKKRKYWRDLKSVQQGDMYGVWHQFASTPYAFLSTIMMAKWFHPDKFSDIDTNQILDEFHTLFMPFEMQGYLAISEREVQ